MCKRKSEAAKSGAGPQWIEQTRELKLPPVTGDAWERITANAKADMLHKGRLFWAVESMKREQAFELPAYESIPAAETDERCDHCGRPAVFTWERSEAYRKKHAGRKVKGNTTPMLPVSWRCAVHVPYFAPELAEQYRDARMVRVSDQAVA